MEFSSEDMFGEETQPKTLYVGNLNAQMTEEFLLVLFSQLGVVKGCKIIQEVILLFGCIFPYVFGGVFWNNGKSNVRRGRPVRHYNPANFHPPQNVHNRVYQPHMMRHRDPTKYPPMVHTYRPVNPGGPMLIRNEGPTMVRTPPRPQSSVAPTVFHHPVQHHPPHVHRLPEHGNKFQSPVSNSLEGGSGINQHGYLSPTYSGWKPIAKPYFAGGTQVAQSTEGITYVVQTTEPYLISTTTRKQNVMVPHFRESNIRHVTPFSVMRLQPDYSENRGVVVPHPTLEPPANTYRPPPNFLLQRPSENTLSIVEKPPGSQNKGFPKFSPRPKPQSTNHNSGQGEVSSNDFQSHSPQLVSKFKISRPKLRVKAPGAFQSNEPENEGIGQEGPPKVTFSAPNNGNVGNSQFHQGPPQSISNQQNQNPKVHKSRPRVKVKTRRPIAQPQPGGFVNGEELSHVLSYRPPGPSDEGRGEQPLRHQPRQQPHPHQSPPAYSRNETHDVSPPFRPPPPPQGVQGHSPFQFPDFMNGFGSSGELQVQDIPKRLPRPPITVPEPTRNKPEREAYDSNRFKQSSQQNDQQNTPRPFSNAAASPDRGVRRKKPKQPPPPQHHQPKAVSTAPAPEPPSAVPFNNDQRHLHPDDFYMPPGFTQNPSAGHNQNPVSFMTMPNSRPQVIHHAPHHHNPLDHHHHHHQHPGPLPKKTDQFYNNYNSHQSQGHNYPQQPKQQEKFNVNQPQSYNSNQQYSSLGSNQHNAYQPNNGNPPNHFLNIQNGHVQGPGHGHVPFPGVGSPELGQQIPYGQGPISPGPPEPFRQMYDGMGSFQYPQHRSPLVRGQEFTTYRQTAPPSGSSLELNSVFPRGEGTTPRNFYAYSVESPSLPHEALSYAPGQGPEQGHSQNVALQSPNNVNLEAYASNEYARIPMEYMNDLRPILLEEESLPTTHIPTTPIQTSSSRANQLNQQQNSFHSSPGSRLEQNSLGGTLKNSFPSTQHPPALGSIQNRIPFQSSEATQSAGGGFMDEFFRSQLPFTATTASAENESSTKVYLVPLSGYLEESTERGGDGGEEDGFRSSASSLTPQVVQQQTTAKSIDYSPHISTSPLHEYSLVATVTPPIQEMDLSRPHAPPKWSKLKKESREPFRSSVTSKYKKLKEVQPGEEIKGSSSTVRPPPSSSTENLDDDGGPNGSYSHPTPLVLKNMTSEHVSEDDSSESNTPQSTRSTFENGAFPNYRRPTRKPLSSTSATPTTVAGTAMTEANRLQFRRRRPPAMLSKRKVTRSEDVGVGVEDDMPPVTTHHPKPLFGHGGKGEEGFESSRISLKSLKREKSSPEVESGGRRGTSGTTPGSLNPSPVTYGESQWFQIKEGATGRSEELDDYPDHVEEKVSGVSAHAVPTVREGEKRRGGEKISFSSKLLSTTPHDVKLEPFEFPALAKVKKSRSLSPKHFRSTAKWESIRQGNRPTEPSVA